MMLSTNFKTFVRLISRILQPEDMSLDGSSEENSLGIDCPIAGVVRPRTMEQVKKIVNLASRHRVPLYPVSQGKNIGYGDRTPYQAGQLVVSLSHLNNIRELDPINGEVVVEPGVTQGQLARFLKEKNIPFWADVTGASPDASILGNALEAGFGHTPLGDHRKNILDMEVILPDGSLMQTGEMPSVGPDLSQLFIQSNFALVTAIRIPLFPIPERTITYVISFASDSDFFKGIGIMKDLRKNGVINSLVHSGNSTRALMTASQFPSDRDPNQALSEEDCQSILNKRSVVKVGAWTTIGALYGFNDEVALKIKRMKTALKGTAKIKFFSDRKVEITDRLLNSSLLTKIKGLDLTRKSFASLKALHGILRGQASEVPSENIYWRVKEKEKLGLAWFSPVIPATAQDAEKLLSLTRAFYAKYNFEMPVTLTLINERKMTAVFNICFDKSQPQQVALAHKAYQELSAAVSDLGYEPYRLGILSQTKAPKNHRKLVFLETLKRALDPFQIMAPGRYGIGKLSSPSLPRNLRAGVSIPNTVYEIPYQKSVASDSI